MTTPFRTGLAGHHVTVSGDSADVVEPARRYLGGWWPATPVEADGTDAPMVRGVTDTGTYRRLVDATGRSERVPMMLGASGWRRASSSAVLAWCPERGIAYHHDRASATTVVAGSHPAEVMFHVTRLARVLVTNALESAGWTLLHAACAVGPRGAVLFPGAAGAGKTTAGLTVSRLPGWRLLATDLCLVRPDRGTVRAAATPTPIRIGIGLLAALGWGPRVTAAIRGAADPYPHQHPLVTSHLAAGRYTACVDGAGRELKFQLMPQELAAWFGMPVSAEATVHDVLIPQLHSDRPPAVEPLAPGAAALADAVVWGPAGSQPNFLDYRIPAPPADRPATVTVLERLSAFAPRRLVLGLDPARNAEKLAGRYG